MGGDIPQWLREPAKAALAALAAAGGLITFVAAVGGAIVWVRYYSAKLPADQALAALPRGELVASGAVMLAAFLILGSLAAIGVYLFRDDESLTRGVSVGLLALVTAEGLVVVLLDVDSQIEQRLVAAEVIALCALLSFSVWRWREKVARDPPPPAWGPVEVASLLVGIFLTAAMVGIVVGLGDGSTSSWLVGLGAVLLLFVFVLSFLWIREGTAQIVGDPPLPAVAAPLPYWVPFWMQPAPLPPAVDQRIRFAAFFRGVIAIVAVTVVALILEEKWLAASLAAAVLLGFVVAQLAERSGYNYFWYGAAVFISVPLLGAIVGITRNIEDPQVQPVALIRTDDGPDKALQGIYVTETKDRVYFATIATKRCTEELVPNSGRLMWVARDDVVAMSLGPPQAVEDAGIKALEMYHALAPKAALAAAGNGQQAVARLEVSGSTTGSAATKPPKRRLEDVGPALRREFKSQQLEAGVVTAGASVNQDVTLVGDGFGERKVDDVTRAVRIGPVRVDVEEGDWHDDEITFKVPPEAKSGLVTIECRPLATQPYLRVRQAPHATLDVTLIAKRAKVSFDSSRSEDPDGGITSRRWRVSGPGIGGDRRTKVDDEITRTFSMLKSRKPSSVSLTVSDSDGQRNTAAALLWRPPPRLVENDGDRSLQRGFKTLRKALAEGKAQVLVYGRARAAGRALAKSTWRRLSGLGQKPKDKTELLASGARCPPVGGARRVDVIILPKDSKVRPPKACKALPKRLFSRGS